MAKERLPSGWTMDVFRPFVESTLDEWKNDLLFVEIGLGATDAILSETENVPGKGDKDHPFNKILNWIAKKVCKQYKMDKKTKKTMILMLRNQSDELTAIIREKQNPGHARSRERGAPRQTSAVKNQRFQQDCTTQQPLEAQTANAIDVDLSPRQLQMKAEFEKKKKEILDSLPEEVKARFGQQYFSKWGKNPLPVLVLSPYNVAPGGIRDMWFEMYEKVKQQGRPESATNLVYWYGAYDDPQNAYSFVVTKSLTPYETGVTKNMNQIPSAVQKKLDGGKRLTPSEKMQVEGLVEMKEDRSKEPDERHGRMVQAFLEDWEAAEEEPEIIVLDQEQATEPSKLVAKTSGKLLNSRKRDSRQVSGCQDETAPSEKKGRSNDGGVAFCPPPTSIRAIDNRLEAPFDAMAAIAKLNDRLERSEKELEDSKQQLQQTKEQTRRLKSQVESNNKEMGNLKAQYDALEEEMEQMKMNHALELGFAQGGSPHA